MWLSDRAYLSSITSTTKTAGGGGKRDAEGKREKKDMHTGQVEENGTEMVSGISHIIKTSLSLVW